MHLTGITDADLKDKPYFGVIREQVADFIGECSILGHNVEFDINFLKNNGIDLTTHQNIDTFKLGQLFFFKERSMNLGHLCDVLGFSFTDQHRALGDTRATVALYQHILSRIEKLSSEEKEVLSFLYSLAGSNPLWTSGIPFTMQPTSVTHIKDLILGHIGEYKKQDRTTIS
jgi:DNA polymerase III epsilon subunit-like protein